MISSMKLLNNSCCFIFCLLVHFACAQFKTNTPIYNGTLSKDKSKIALVDSEKIYVVNSSNLQEIYSKPYDFRDCGIISEIYFANNNDSILCYRTSAFDGDLERDLNLTYFSDSLYFLNFYSGKNKSLQGSVFLNFGNGFDDFCLFVNTAHEFNFNNQKYWRTDGTTLYSKFHKNLNLNFPVYLCALSGDGKKIAVITGTSEYDKSNELRVFETQTLNQTFSEKLPERNYSSMCFSESGGSIYLQSERIANFTMFSKHFSDLEDIKDTLVLLHKNSESEIERIVGKQENGVRLKSSGGEFKLVDVKSGIDLHVLYANACELFNIKNAFLLNESEVIVFGSSYDYTTTKSSGAANKIKIQDVSAFTKIDSRKGSVRLYDSESVKIVSNTSSINPKENYSIVLGKNKKIVYAVQDRLVEMWDVESASLLHAFSFEQAVEIFTDESDSVFVVIEKHEEFNEENVRLHIVSIATGDSYFQILSKADSNELIQKEGFCKLNSQDTEIVLKGFQKTWPWETKQFRPFFDTSITTDNTDYLLVEKQLLNLKTLQRTEIENYSDKILLGNLYKGMSAEFCTQSNWTSQDKSNKRKDTFFLVRNALNSSDTLAVSEHFELQANVSGKLYNHELFKSSTSRFVWAFVFPFFEENKRDLYVFDIKKNKVFEIRNVGLSYLEFDAKDSLFQLIKIEKKSDLEWAKVYELYDANTFKKLNRAASSFFSISKQQPKFNDLNAPENNFGALYIYSEANNKTFGVFNSGKMFVWKENELSPYLAISLGSGKPLHCSFVGNNILIVLDSREAFFINPNSCSVVCSLLLIPNGESSDVLWFLPDGSFYALKNTIPKFHMVKGNKAFPLLNYEAILNRPDKILSAIGLAEAETIEAYELAYLKRNTKLKTDELNFKFPLPRLTWKSKIPDELRDSLVSFSVEIERVSSEPLIAHVLINGVPIYGMNGVLIEPKINELNFTTTLENGNNEILVYTESQNGLTSFPLSKEIVSLYSTERRVFFVGIGVSDYLDSVKNLTYAHSDILKLEDVIQSAYGKRCNSHVFINHEATKENIKNLKNYLMSSGVNDIVILAFAGHGIIGKDRNFYFCSHDIDFQNPENNGLSFSEIESLLDSIPARKKLLLLDACHSGELDSSATPVFVSNLELKKDARGIDVVSLEEPSSQKEINFLVESLFANLNSGTGSFIISAAGGSEYAFETEKTGGVFTHSFIESFRSHYYSDNSDATISTLQKETYQKVTQLTKGAQRPTTRSENTRYSWKFDK